MSRQIELSIARSLASAAALYSDDDTEERATFRFGTFIVRCRARRSSIEAVAAKFKRGSSRLVGPGYKPFTMRAAYQSLQVEGPYNWRKV